MGMEGIGMGMEWEWEGKGRDSGNTRGSPRRGRGLHKTGVANGTRVRPRGVGVAYHRGVSVGACPLSCVTVAPPPALCSPSRHRRRGPRPPAAR